MGLPQFGHVGGLSDFSEPSDSARFRGPYNFSVNPPFSKNLRPLALHVPLQQVNHRVDRLCPAR